MLHGKNGKWYQPITIWLEYDQHRQAKRLGINISQAARDGVARVIETREQETCVAKLSNAPGVPVQLNRREN